LSSAGTPPAYGATLGEIMATLEAAGFSAQMAARSGGMILCFTCRRESPAADFTLLAQRRTEGASDPDDMLAVVGLACPNCQAQGTAVLGYGPEADPDDAEVVVRLGVVNPG
jgi:hypothetical protein